MSRAPSPPLRLAVVGCGAVASGHYLPALAALSGARVELLVDRDRRRADTLAGRWGVPATAADAAEVVGRADAAILALPNHLHAPVALELLARGVHVLVEKPMALTLAECDAMLAAAEKSGAVLGVGLQFRYFDSTRLVGEVLASGLLGPLRGFDLALGVISRWQFATDFVLRKETAGGGVLADYGVHVLDLLLAWLGPFRAVRCRHDARGGVESDCELELTFESGVAGHCEISRSRDLCNTCIFRGEKGTLEVGIWDPDPPVILRTAGGSFDLAGRARRPGKPPLTFNGAFLRSLEDFAGAILEGREPLVSGREGRRSLELIAACYAAAEPLELPWMHPPELAGEAP